MGIITLSNNIQDLKKYIDLAYKEISEQVESWEVTGNTIIEIIDNLPF